MNSYLMIDEKTYPVQDVFINIEHFVNDSAMKNINMNMPMADIDIDILTAELLAAQSISYKNKDSAIMDITTPQWSIAGTISNENSTIQISFRKEIA